MHKKKITWIVGMLALFMFLALSPAHSQTKELRVVGSWNSLTMYKNFEMPFWTEVVPAELGLKTSMTSLSQITLKGPAVLRQMSMGVFDAVHTVVDYVVDDSPALAGLDLPALATDIADARKVVEAYRPVLEEYLARDFDAKLLSVAPYPAQVIFCRDRINGLADLKGKKIRASGWTTSEFVNAVGATGVTLSFSEVPQALQRGVVDCAVTGSLSGYSAGWGEVSNFVYPLPIGGWDYVIGTMSQATWNSLSPDQQAKLQSLIKEKLEDPAWEVTKKETQEGLDCLSGGECPHGTPNKLELVPISEGDRELAKKLLVEAVLPAWSKKVDSSAVSKWNETIGQVVGFKIE
ncbi:TRAP-type C4-dicarboxylate transport system, substrate-binding protein [Desulfacinum infernum DSM 9756]|jgi:TRAP-type C4-dicarboxylate transport system substrate-binding protein|uniref:TRAP-type C4-dicarboxylate transport system, substrate-binding protein n=1 Tax=Desulfacinum infernum DSM 9756 TaxID=1121391 RepID=A0A1M4T9B8_9BACT|nr:TRAP transporter substrate-binding protein [Desulfacinum infernum]MBZ4658746.1 Extracellular solute-binding protein family 7 [Desulfacinum sp.]SHE41015.1 TRAP-type C4-dicarboxylate transport system, substrate-binding protein [Desulfacinum infernum DSM 9756]